jgi:hypothetical protein
MPEALVASLQAAGTASSVEASTVVVEIVQIATTVGIAGALEATSTSEVGVAPKIVASVLKLRSAPVSSCVVLSTIGRLHDRSRLLRQGTCVSHTGHD